MMQKKNSAGIIGVVLLSAGSGRRMNSSIPKQYMELCGKPVLSYSIECFQNNPFVKDIIIVAAADSIDMIWSQYIKPYKYTKVTKVIEGGKERYHSVYNGLTAMADSNVKYVMIHDGARPFVSDEIINRLYESVLENKACIPAVRSKDTICIADIDEYIQDYPARKYVWNVQTPQTFVYKEIKDAFDIFMEDENRYLPITDDAMVYKKVTGSKVKIVDGDYSNIKITTPEDIEHAKAFLS